MEADIFLMVPPFWIVHLGVFVIGRDMQEAYFMHGYFFNINLIVATIPSILNQNMMWVMSVLLSTLDGTWFAKCSVRFPTDVCVLVEKWLLQTSFKHCVRFSDVSKAATCLKRDGILLNDNYNTMVSWHSVWGGGGLFLTLFYQHRHLRHRHYDR